MSLFSKASSEGESEPPDLAEQVPTMRLFPSSSEKSYVTVKAFIEEVRKTASRQGNNVVIKGGNKKEKNGDLREVKLGCTKEGKYKEYVREVGEVRQGGRQKSDGVRVAPLRIMLYERITSGICKSIAKRIIILPSHPKLLLQIRNFYQPIL